MEKQTHETKNGEIDNDKLWGVLAYIFFLIPLVLKTNRSSFLNYHINQGIILTVVSFAGWFIFGMLPGFIGFIFRILMVVLFVTGIINVSKKEKKPLPIIGNLFSFIK